MQQLARLSINKGIKMWKYIRPYVRSLYRIISGLIYFLYDYLRYLKYCGWHGNMKDPELRNYNLAMVQHAVEKSLSYKERRQGSGWANVYRLLEWLDISRESGNTVSFQDKGAKQVVEKYIELPENMVDRRSEDIKEQLVKFDNVVSDQSHGFIDYSLDDYQKGALNNPEEFFFSRYTLREFRNKVVDDELIKRGIRLAMKTPSVCNRQAWAIYHTSDNEIRDIALSHQQGNKPFGVKIPNLIIIAIDLKAFTSADMHYQHWIDGGLLSMSLMYAFHSLGLATCALNWSAKPKNDISLRRSINIEPGHSVIMMLGVGYPDVKNKVCASVRRPIEEIYFEMKKGA